MTLSGNLLPSRTSVSCSLAEDTMLSGALGISAGTNQAAVFRNPFTDGDEEVLYINGGWMSWFSPATGQSVRVCAADQVVAVVHPRGVVYAFCLNSADKTAPLVTAWCLQSDGGGGQQWVDAHLPSGNGAGGARQISVQYIGSRPAEAVVHVLVDTEPTSTYIAYGSMVAPDGSAPSNGSWWSQVARYVLTQVVPAAQKQVVMGLDGTVVSAGGSVLWMLLDKGEVQQTTFFPPGGSDTLTVKAEGVTSLCGLYVNPTGLVGCMMLESRVNSAELLAVIRPGHALEEVVASWSLDCAPTSGQVWTDGRGLMHVFLEYGSTLRVAHQLGHTYNELVWGPTFRGPTVNSAPVAVDVAGYWLDMHPDTSPSQLVLHTELVVGPERCSMYSQDVDTTWWSRETIRTQASPGTYPARRYLANVTLENSFGGPVAGHQVLLSAQESVEVEVGGTFFRLGANHQPVHQTTDMRGVLRLAVLADSLAGVDITVGARGMSDSRTVNPAVGVHNFLAGTGTLPNHPAGISAAALITAQKSSGGWVFPALHDQDLAATGLPDADQVVAMLSELFRQPSGLVGVRREASGGFWDEGSTRIGDYWEAIRSGAVTVTKTQLNPDTRTADISISWFGGLEYDLTATWADAISAGHVAEAIFNSLGAKIDDVIDWLCWPLDFQHAFLTKDAIRDGLTQLSTYLPTVAAAAAKQVSTPGWFSSQSAQLATDVDRTMTTLAGVGLDPSQRPPTHASGRTAGLAEMVSKPTLLDSPHTEWLIGKLMALPSTGPAGPLPDDAPPEFAVATQAFHDLLDLFTTADIGMRMTRLLEANAGHFLDTFDGSDPAQFRSTQLRTLLELFDEDRELLNVGLHFCDVALPKVVAFITAAAACIVPALGLANFTEPSSYVLTLWRSMLISAGRDEPLDLGNFLGVMAALPTTAQFLAITDRSPFPSGKFPSLTDAQPVPVDTQLSMQLLAGLSKRSDAWRDQYLNSLVHGDQPISHPGARYFALGTAVSELFYRGITDLPIFYGAAGLSGTPSATDKLMWGEYLASITVCLADFVAAVVWPYSAGKEIGDWLLGSLPSQPGNTATAAFGAISAGFRMAMAPHDPPNEMDRSSLIAQMTSAVPPLTASMRDGAFADLRKDLDFAEKSFVDNGSHSAVGTWRAINAAGQLLLFDTDPPFNGTLPDGKVGVAYNADGLGVLTNPSTDWPPITWTTSGGLPPGLTPLVSGDLGEQFQLTGTPTTAGTFTFLVIATNSYQPNVVVKEAYRVVIS